MTLTPGCVLRATGDDFHGSVFPAKLLALASALGMSIELSIYDADEG